MTHSVNGCSIGTNNTPGQGSLSHPSSEAVMYANLVDAVKMLNKLVENTHYNCTREEAELIWRLRFVTRIGL